MSLRRIVQAIGWLLIGYVLGRAVGEWYRVAPGPAITAGIVALVGMLLVVLSERGGP